MALGCLEVVSSDVTLGSHNLLISCFVFSSKSRNPQEPRRLSLMRKWLVGFWDLTAGWKLRSELPRKIEKLLAHIHTRVLSHKYFQVNTHMCAQTT